MADNTAALVAAIRSDYPEPLWVQAAELIKGEIAKGVLRPGMRLPPERDLCVQLGISRVTLRKALTRLVEEGVLSASHGRGWYVASVPTGKEWPNTLESFTETAARMNLVPSSTVLRADTAPATLDEAEELAIAPGTPLFQLERIRFLDGVPTAVDFTRIPVSVVPDIAKTDFTVASLYGLLAEVGAEPVRADTTVEARSADDEAATRLSVEPGRPVLVMRQLAYDSGDRPLFVSRIVYAGDRYRLRTSFSRSVR